MHLRAKMVCSLAASMVAGLSFQQTNAEANIAINPNDARQVLVSAFNNQVDVGGQPYYLSALTSGWMTWTIANTQVHKDTSIDWSPSGTIYMGRLFTNAGNDDVAI